MSRMDYTETLFLHFLLDLPAPFLAKGRRMCFRKGKFVLKSQRLSEGITPTNLILAVHYGAVERVPLPFTLVLL